MPLVDVADDTFVVAEPARVAALVADPHRWRGWWPDLDLTVQRDRGVKGHQWVARSRPGARVPVVGTLEVWLEPWGDGVVLHHYARLDLLHTGLPHTGVGSRRAGPRDPAAWARREHGRRVRAWKRHARVLKDALESERAGRAVHDR